MTQWVGTYHRDLPTRDIGVLGEAVGNRTGKDLASGKGYSRVLRGSWHLYKLTELKSGCNLNMWIYRLHLKCSYAPGDSFFSQAEPENSQNERFYFPPSLKILSLELLPPLSRLQIKAYPERKMWGGQAPSHQLHQVRGQHGQLQTDSQATLFSKARAGKSIQSREESL